VKLAIREGGNEAVHEAEELPILNHDSPTKKSGY
jgi:hypothetical protein